MKNVRKIKICYIASIDVTIRFILFNHLKFLKREGYDVYAVCSPGKWIKDIEKEGIKVKTIRFKRKISPIYDLITLAKLFFYLKKEKFDIVHTHTPKPSLLGQMAARLAGIPIVADTVHGFYFNQKKSLPARIFFRFIRKASAKFSDIIFLVNREDMETASRERLCRKDKIKYFGGGIDINRFNPEIFSKDFINKKKKELNIPADFKVVGIVARLVEEKGYLDIFKAFKRVLNDFPKTMLLAVGQSEPEKKDAIKPEIVKKYGIERNAIFLGERTDINEIYALMDIFVLPSYREGLGISIIEASAMEKPVVATDIRGCREAVENKKTGILIPQKNPQKLAEAIIYLFSNPAEAKKMGKEGRKKALDEFDERIIFDRIKKEYDALLNQKIKK